ncbi:MAG TPA: HWE histidine kinase domain-containing protein [Luteibacter sp.]|uniref:sensor histidine kinase n=1 Tax=Luteibacter sp. TaxID=1886636 RepID=UPI002C1F565E|nr:HWE histidine kinase domain-containing protein [Luteibacter sp.]HVI56697.1 HWE histidine kinase domain-containing protein [Luteibacter sp.]
MYDEAKSPYERSLIAGDREFRELADFAPVMIWRSGTDQLCDWFNTPWLTYTGRAMVDEVGNGWAAGVHPDDVDRCLATYVGAFRAREPFSMEYRLRRHDGEYRWLLDNGKPFYRDNRFAGYWGSCIDVTAHREAARAQRILVNELSHRVKNTLAVVQAMATQTFVGDRPVADALTAFESRLQALAGAHDMLVNHAWEDVALRGVVEATVAPHDPGQSRIVIDGPPLMVASAPAVSVAMAVHELLTNATKYGALSTDTGRVDLGWRFDPASERLQMTWKESGGPPVATPTRRGFGVRFIERVLAGQAGGAATVAFEEDGVRCCFEAPARSWRHVTENFRTPVSIP